MEKKVKKEKLSKEAKKEKRAIFVNKLKKNLVVNKTKTILLSIILIALFIVVNVMTLGADFPQYDLTENQIYTLSDASKDVLKNVKTKVNIVAYGFDETSNLVGLAKQYVATNPDYLTFELLTEESNNSKVQKYGLSSGYMVVILESGDKYKLIDAQSEFTVYDNTVYGVVDRTEQVITNGILGLDSNTTIKKIYIVDGHGEYTEEEMYSTLQSIGAENFEYQRINLITTELELGDNDVLVILSPMNDINEIELKKLREYTNKGVNVLYTQDYTEGTLPNFTAFLSDYGVSVVNGYIIETDSNYTAEEGSIYFMPHVSSTHEITSEMYSDGYYMLLSQAGKLTFSSDDVLSNLKVERNDLLKTSTEAIFTANLDDVEVATNTMETGEFVLGSILTKTVGKQNDKDIKSELIVVSTGSFITDYYMNEKSPIPLSSIGRNRDFFINSLSELTDKTNYLKIRKGMDSSTFESTIEQRRIVFAICVLIPISIIVLGIVIYKLRKRRK